MHYGPWTFILSWDTEDLEYWIFLPSSDPGDHKTAFANIATMTFLESNPLKIDNFGRTLFKGWVLEGSSAFSATFYATIISEVTHFQRNVAFCQIWPMITSSDLNIDLSEKWPDTLECTGVLVRAIEGLLSRHSIPLRSWGRMWWPFWPPPPPARAKVAGTPTQVKVNNRWILLSLSRKFRYPSLR